MTRRQATRRAHPGIDALRALQEEIKRDLQSAGVEAKRQWKRLEPALRDIERRADDFSQASLKAVQETVERLSEFREMLRGFGHSERVIASHLFLVPKAEEESIGAAQSVPGRGRGLAISHYMTPAPHTIAIERTLADAHSLMRQFRIRHLPVLDRGTLVGIVSERDLHLLETLKDVNPSQVTVEEAMSQDVFVTEPGTSLARVAAIMASRKLGSTVIVHRGQVLGIFSTVDALRALSALSREKRQLKPLKTRKNQRTQP
ncbi:MAG TPA: CBS domain-containing protein [Myxococcaceae bacterium]|nr:CBS domain-containing protein [Myxococcaceae bacterium]